MHTLWKLAAAAFVVLGVTAVTSTLTTAYLARPAAPASPALVTEPAARRAAMVEVARPRPLPARTAGAPRRAPAPVALAAAAPAAAPVMPGADTVVREPVAVTPHPAAPATPAATDEGRAESAAPAPAAATVAAPAPTTTPAQAPTATDCDASGRTWKIAKPGLIGTAIGAGVGAAGGAIASGGKGAGQGAIIGGLAGAALGSGYGAYRTRNECGNIFGGDQKVSDAGATRPAAGGGTPVIAEARAAATSGAEAPFAAPADRITIYSAR